MTQELRDQILLELRKTDPAFVQDITLAEALAKPVKEIQDQLDILDMRGYVQLSRALGPSYHAVLTAKGKEYLEDLENQEPEKPKKPMGFK